MKSKKNLTRFAYESTGFKGWRVSVTRHGEIFTRYYSDLKCGSKNKSLKAAEECLKKFLAKLDKAPVISKKRKSRHGNVGVSETSYTNSRSGERRIVWVASWPEGDKRKVVKFPAAKLGARKAKQMAIAARKEAEERLGLNMVHRFSRETVEELKNYLASI